MESRKKRVICDSDDDEVPTPQDVKPSIASEGWFEKRDLAAMTNAEISANKKAALASRYIGSNKPIPKKRRVVADSEEDSDSDSDVELSDSSVRSKNKYLPYSIQEDNLSILTEKRGALGSFTAARLVEKVNARASRASNRSGGGARSGAATGGGAAAGKGSAARKRIICLSDDDEESSGEAKEEEKKTVRTKPEVHVIDSDGDDADDGAAGDGVYSNWRDPVGDSDDDEGIHSAKKLAAMEARRQDEVEKRSSQVLQRCVDLSRQLRSELRSWGGSSAIAAEQGAEASSGELEIGDCVNLTTMALDVSQSPSTIILEADREGGGGEDSAGQASKLITQTAVVSFCPDLVLKDYQLVGINWLKLLHSKDVNGVLADDMGLG
jgi:hypothetical protein